MNDLEPTYAPRVIDPRGPAGPSDDVLLAERLTEMSQGALDRGRAMSASMFELARSHAFTPPAEPPARRAVLTT